MEESKIQKKGTEKKQTTQEKKIFDRKCSLITWERQDVLSSYIKQEEDIVFFLNKGNKKLQTGQET